MKKIWMILIISILLSGCSAETTQNANSDLSQKNIDEEFQNAKEGKFENLNFVCDEVNFSKDGQIYEMWFPLIQMKDYSVTEKLEVYKNTIFPKLYGTDEIDVEHIYDLNSEIVASAEETAEKGLQFEYDYASILEQGGNYEGKLALGYYDRSKFQFMESFSDCMTLNIGQGVLGEYGGSSSCFVTSDFDVVKSYDCRFDDLSDSYLLKDGEKTVAQAKIEIEEYLNECYPLIGESNGIQNEVLFIDVKKIPNTEYYMFSATRTLSYNGIPVREEGGNMSAGEIGVMGEAMLCESNKVDILLGFVNCFTEASDSFKAENLIPFSEVLERVSYYLTGDTTFDIMQVGLEYRMFKTSVNDVPAYKWIPYWTFVAKNPNDDTIFKIYVDMKTGEIME